MNDIRTKRLRQWLGEFDGSIAEFVRAYGLDKSKASYISQILGGHRPLGERAARKLEVDCGRPHGWLDVEDDDAVDLRYDKQRFNQLNTDDRGLIEEFIDFVLKRSERSEGSTTPAGSGKRVTFQKTLEAPQGAQDTPGKGTKRKTSGDDSLNLPTGPVAKSRIA
ncbi:hypothetical protein [Pseudomonas sp.]|jgi:hypothetical protein|uniref:hypothetical protein n=1 Tax=Pseudomonas sp. TaxID=306 RepID=UPI002ED83383